MSRTMGFQLTNGHPGYDPNKKPEFAGWLANPKAKLVTLVNQADLLEWICETWDDDLVEPLIAKIDERNAIADHHSFAAVKMKRARPEGCTSMPWELGRTEALERGHLITTIGFFTSSEWLND